MDAVLTVIVGLAPSARLEGDRQDEGVRLVGPPLSTLAALAALHAHVHSSGADYAGLFLAALASWALVPGLGEAALIAAGISAAHHHLSLASVLLVAWAGGGAGATIGWIVGLKGGRGLVTAPGPLHHLRLALIERGDRFYERYGLVALVITPPLIAGIHHMRWSRFLPATAISTLLWALSIGLGAYLVGPSITDIAADAGIAGGLLLGLLLVSGIVLVIRRRSRRST
jgi:membrane-associated protein